MWPAPVKIEEQMIPVNQPADLPILIFACRVSSMGKKSVLCIDKLNGRISLPGEGSRSRNFMRVVGDAKKKTVDLINGTNMVTLTFTDKPWSPASGTAPSRQVAIGQRCPCSVIAARKIAELSGHHEAVTFK